MSIVPVTGDDLREALSMHLQRQVVSFAAPEFVTMRIRSEGQNHDVPLRFGATSNP